jgi:8-oxo-dGTP pyrophosphatase MutT (NUDIX family)
MEETLAKALARVRLDYAAERAHAEGRAAQGETWKGARVLVLLEHAAKGANGPYSFVLNKRSRHVSQPGDLCFPGGHPDPRKDRALAAILPRLLAREGRANLDAARLRDPEGFSILRYHLAGALRECFEEVGVAPWNQTFLGALPPYRMEARRRIIHPMAAMLRPGTRIRKNPREIEKNLRLPVGDLFDKDRYGLLTLRITGKTRQIYPVDEFTVPCYLVRDPEGGFEALWGATFKIVLAFARAVMGFEPPEGGPARAARELYPAP